MALSFLRSLWGRREPERGSTPARDTPSTALAPATEASRRAAWRLTVLGCGDAFGAGGRLQTSYHLETPRGQILLDCGATTLTGLHRQQIDPNAVETILITHLHGDHFGGLVWWLMHAHYVANRTQPLTIAGPAGLRDRLSMATEALFPGSSTIAPRYAITYREFAGQVPMALAGIAVTPFEVHHPSGAQAYAVRLEGDGRCLSFSGDTEWVDTLLPCASGADLFIVDCFGYDRDVGFHMSWKTISSRLDQLKARRIVLTHMGSEMLSRRDQISDSRVVLAEDGLVLDILDPDADTSSRRRP